jgi:hypothetical protein
MRFSGASGTNGDVVMAFDPQVQSVCVPPARDIPMPKRRMEDASGKKHSVTALDRSGKAHEASRVAHRNLNIRSSLQLE